MKNKVILITMLAILGGCSRHLVLGLPGPVGAPGPTGQVGPEGPPGSSAISPEPTEVQTVVQGYNEYLVSQGSDPITQGLRCTLYNVPNMPSTPCILSTSITGCSALSGSVDYANIATWTYTGTVNQPNEGGNNGFNMLPQALQPLYASNFEVVCTGYLVNTDYNYHEFDIDSDDGSLLYVNGSLVANNDGLHSIQDVKGVKYLEAQVYSFEIEYFQGPGNVALIVNMDGQILPSASLYH